MAKAAPEYGDAETKQVHRQAAARADGPVVEGATEARQGVTGHGVRYVLVFGLMGVVIAFAMIYAGFFS